MDDSLLFCKATFEECGKVMRILSTYEEALGQKINKNKIILFFSSSAKENIREIIKGVLGVQEIKQYEKYFGLPSLVGRGKRACFNYTEKRVWRKLKGLESKLLSQAGRKCCLSQ